MSGARLKNIILLILVVMNLFLAVMVVGQERRSARYEESAVADAVDILNAGGISLARETVARAITFAPQTVERDRAYELGLVRALLGEVEVDDSLGSILIVYTSEAGRAQLRGNGDFAVNFFTDRQRVTDGDFSRHALETLKLLDFDGEVTELRTEGAGRVVVVRQKLLGQPVFSCAATLTYEDGVLTGISGRRVIGEPVPEGGVTALEPATLLLRFRASVREMGDVCSEIHAITPGYLLSSTLTLPLRLTPVLLIATDTHTYYQNAADGTLTRR